MTNPRTTAPPAGKVEHVHCSGCRDLRPHRHKDETTLICEVCGRGRGLPLDAAAFDEPGPVTRTVAAEAPCMNGHAIDPGVVRLGYEPRTAAEVLADPPQLPGAADAIQRTAVELQRDLAIATAENARLRSEVERWTKRVKLLEAMLRAMVDIAEGRRAP